MISICVLPETGVLPVDPSSASWQGQTFHLHFSLQPFLRIPGKLCQRFSVPISSPPTELLNCC